jgi:integrase
MPLTVRSVEAAKPKDKPYKLADGQGLYLFVSPAGSKSWRANYTVGGKQKTRTYGQFPAVSLAEAREAHRQARDTPADTTTPAFEVVARQWIQKHTPGLSNAKHRLQVEKTLEVYAFPHIGKTPIGDLRRADLVRAVESVGSKVETAHRVAGRITAVFNYAQDAGILEGHPAANLTRILTPRKVKKPMASIPPEEAGELLNRIQTYPDPVTRLGLLLMAHTFVRVGELRGFDSGELREDGAVWLVPESRMKMGLPHVVPLSKQAQAIVRQLGELSGSSLLLESPAKPGQPISENTMLFALYRLGYRGRMTVHGFRALASTVLNEQSGFSHDVIERQLAHKESDAVRAAYNRAEYLDQRRKLMAWWSDWLEDAAQGRKRASG